MFPLCPQTRFSAQHRCRILLLQPNCSIRHQTLPDLLSLPSPLMSHIVMKTVSASLACILRNSDRFATTELRWHSSPVILSMKIVMWILYFIISMTDYEKQYTKEKLHRKTKQHYKRIYHFGGASLTISPKCQRSAEVGEKKITYF